MTSEYYKKPGLSNAYPREKPSPRRALRLVAIAAFIILIITLLSSSPVPSSVSSFTHFHSTAHQPPEQPNSTSGDTKWYSDWKWHNPFSFSITQDETRSVLPPLKKKPPIYAFYDADAKRDEATQAAESKLLLIWRRAWWAQGFKPVVLGRAEAKLNPLYETLQKKSVDKTLETEIIRWLAWGQMGTGILANWLILPMGPYDDSVLSYLRRGDYPGLSRYDGLGGGLYSGNQAGIKEAITQALKSPLLKTSTSFLEVMEPKTFTIEPKPAALAYYESSIIGELYKPIFATLSNDKPVGLTALAGLITSHLHLSFLSSFSTGISILNPYEEATSLLAEPAIHLAASLTACPPTSMPLSCPPNYQKCTPCRRDPPFPIKTQSHFINTSTLYTIGTITHPYTLASLLGRTKHITVRHIRRDTDRDPWLFAVTQLTLGKKLGGPSRIVSFKETVASEWGAAHGLWLTESALPSQRELEWRFGFELAAHNTSFPEHRSLTPVTSSGPPNPVREKAARKQEELIKAAKEVVKKGVKGDHKGIRDAVEAWNLADTEAWRFVRAFSAREAVERKKWEAAERRFAGGERDGWGKWFDQ